MTPAIRERMINVVMRPGGAEGSRTPDLLIANEALYQLSYGPRTGFAPGREGPGGEGGHKSGSLRPVKPALALKFLKRRPRR